MARIANQIVIICAYISNFHPALVPVPAPSESRDKDENDSELCYDESLNFNDPSESDVSGSVNDG